MNKLMLIAGAFTALLTAAAAIAEKAPGAGAQTGREWTGLVYSPDAPPSGTADRELFDAKNYLRNNMPATAKDMFLRAIKMDPSLAEAHFWLSGALRALGDGAAAETHLRQAYALDPGLRAHEAELARFGPRGQATQLPKLLKKAGAPQCDDLYATCMASATRCTMRGCETDFSRQTVCTSERNQCEGRNR